jgi:hypothetical protein
MGCIEPNDIVDTESDADVEGSLPSFIAYHRTA